MFFTIQDNKNSTELDRYYAWCTAIMYPKKAAEKALNSYLVINYEISLLQACLKIISRAKFMKNGSNEIVIIIPDKKLDKLASIITYGTGKIQGSGILKAALTDKRRTI